PFRPLPALEGTAARFLRALPRSAAFRRAAAALDPDRPRPTSEALNAPSTMRARNGGMSAPPLVIAARDTLDQIEAWGEHLRGEKRLSPKTLEAYSRDLEQFLSFLTTHLGNPPA